MQVRKGVRRIGALMLVLLATGAMADTPGAVEVPSPEAQAEILNPVEGDAPRARFLALRSDEAARWKADLQHMNVVTDVRDDVIRFGFSLYQSEEDVERLIHACARLT